MNTIDTAQEVFETLSWGEVATTSAIIATHNEVGLDLSELDELTNPELTDYLVDSVLERNPSLPMSDCTEIASHVAYELCSISEMSA